MRKRILALGLVGLMLFSSVDMIAYADDVKEETEVQISEEDTSDELTQEDEESDESSEKISEEDSGESLDETLDENLEEVADKQNVENEDTAFVMGYEEDPFAHDAATVYENDDYPVLYSGQSKYDPSEDLPSVRNQNPYGTCWAFASTCLAEFSIMSRLGEMRDFSEAHLAYFNYHTAVDAYGMTSEDSNKLVGNYAKDDVYLDIGGNYQSAMQTLLNWHGNAAEENYPYSNVSAADETYTVADATNDVAHVQNVYEVNLETNRVRAKELIKEYGAIGVSYNDDVNGNNVNYSSTYNSYYTPNPIGTNHAVSIVGWDDDFPKEHFSAGVPVANGAWLIRNSWGKSSKSHYGYFWMSYYDASLTSTGFVFDAVDKSEDAYYDNVYYYDGSHITIGYPVNEGARVANIFLVKKEKEEIKAVGFQVENTAQLPYTVSVYKLQEGATNPEDGTLLTEVSGTTVYEGYYTVPLEEAVYLSQNDRYSVVITFHKMGYIGREYTYNSGKYLFTAGCSEGQSYYTDYYGKNWYDASEQEDYGNYRIKSYTNTVEAEECIETTGITIDSNRTEGMVGDPFVLKASVFPKNATDRKIVWTSSDEEVATVSAGGYVTPLSEGEVTITAKTLDGRFSDSITLSIVCYDTAIQFCTQTGSVRGSFGLYVGDTATCYVKGNATENIYAGSDVEWAVGNENIVSVDENGVLTAKHAGITTVTALKGNMAATCNVFVDMTVSAISQENQSIELTWTKFYGAERYQYSVLYADGASEAIAEVGADAVYNAEDNTYTLTFANPKSEEHGYPSSYNIYAKYSGTTRGGSASVQYKVAYELNGGSNDDRNPQAYRVKDIPVKGKTLYDASKSGHTFEGWYTNPECTGAAVNSIAYKTTGNLKFYAKWSEKEYAITYHLNGGTNHASNPVKYTFLSETIVLQNPTKEAGVFEGWYTDAEYTEKISSITSGSTGNLNLYAKWKEKQYRVAFDGNSASSGTMNTTESIPYSSNYTIPENAYVKKGYSFTGWNTQADGKGMAYLPGQSVSKLSSTDGATVTLYAQWSKDKYIITYHLDGGTNVEDNPTFYYVDSHTISLRNPIKTGYVFDGWYEDASLTGEPITDITEGSVGNRDFYAKWSVEIYTITYHLDEGLNNQDNPTEYSVDTETFALKPATKEDKVFGGWYYNADYEGAKVTEIAKGSMGNIDLYARWSDGAEYSIVFYGNGATSGTMESMENLKCDENQTLRANAFSRTGYLFAKWTTNPDGTGTSYTNAQVILENTMNSNETVSLYAQWTPIKYNIKFDKNKLTLAGDIKDVSSLEYDKEIILPNTTTTKKGYILTWNTKADGKGTTYAVGTKCKNLTSKNKTTVILYALWVPQNYSVKYVLNGGINNKNNPTIYDITKATIKLQNPTRKGYKFEGWYSDSKYKTKVTQIVKGSTGDKTFYAKWSAINYSIKYKLNGGKNCAKNPASYKVTTSTIKLKKPTRKGYKFVGWYSDSKYKTKVTQIAKGSTGNITLYAKWSVNHYSIRFDGNGATSGTMADMKQCSYTSKYKLTANKYKKKGYKFAGWNTKKDGTGTTYANQAKVKKLSYKNGATVTLYAIWKK